MAEHGGEAEYMYAVPDRSMEGAPASKRQRVENGMQQVGEGMAAMYAPAQGDYQEVPYGEGAAHGDEDAGPSGSSGGEAAEPVAPARGKTRRKANERPVGKGQLRQAFSKRQKGLVAKAFQLSQLTDAKVFLFIVNDKGSSWAYASPGFGRSLVPSHIKQLHQMAGWEDATSSKVVPHPGHVDPDLDDRALYIDADEGMDPMVGLASNRDGSGHAQQMMQPQMEAGLDNGAVQHVSEHPAHQQDPEEFRTLLMASLADAAEAEGAHSAAHAAAHNSHPHPSHQPRSEAPPAATEGPSGAVHPGTAAPAAPEHQHQQNGGAAEAAVNGLELATRAAGASPPGQQAAGGGQQGAAVGDVVPGMVVPPQLLTIPQPGEVVTGYPVTLPNTAALQALLASQPQAPTSSAGGTGGQPSV